MFTRIFADGVASLDAPHEIMSRPTILRMSVRVDPVTPKSIHRLEAWGFASFPQ